MNRKLHNTFLGLSASTALLSLAIALGAPANQPASYEDNLAAAIEAEVLVALAEAGIDVESAERAAAAARVAAITVRFSTQGAPGGDGQSRSKRNSVALPYFSFAPRG